MIVLQTLFWGSIFVILYTYFLFPIILYLRGLIFRKPHLQEDITPEVSLVIAAYNEASIIEKKIENTLKLNYPKDKLEVIIASDGSSDGTNEIVEKYVSDGIRLLALPRGGKNATLNAAVPEATGEIIIFSDANSMYGENAIRALVRHFADPQVGGVGGTQTYLSGKDSAAGESLYWQYDQTLKELQSLGGNITSATGAIYAIRKKLFRKILPHVVDDNFISIGVVLQGYRLVFTRDAIAYEPVAESGAKEFSRKIRIIQMGLYSVLETASLLNPFRFKFYSLQLFTHKILRRYLFIPFILLFISNLLLWKTGMLFQLLALGQLAFYALAVVGVVIEKMHVTRPKILKLVVKVLLLPYYFCLVYIASMIAAYRVLIGHKMDRWNTVQRATDTG